MPRNHSRPRPRSPLASSLALAAVLGASACAHTLAPAADHALAPVPVIADAPAIEVCWIETAAADASGELATVGPTELPTWHATASALLVRHPKGDVLVDTGSSATLRDDVRELKPGARVFSKASAGKMQWRGDVPGQLRAIGADPAGLHAIVLSHAHPDHAGGVEALPGIPVLVGPGEIDFVHEKLAARDHHVFPRQGRVLRDRMVPVDFDPKPYSTFDQSVDLFADGRVVLVPLFGHTPGSLGTFVDLGDGRRIFHVGDVVLVQESIERRVVKGKLMQPTDVDKPKNAANVARLSQLHELDPALTILPAHDRDVWKRLFGETSPREPACIGTRPATSPEQPRQLGGDAA